MIPPRTFLSHLIYSMDASRRMNVDRTYAWPVRPVPKLREPVRRRLSTGLLLFDEDDEEPNGTGTRWALLRASQARATRGQHGCEKCSVEAEPASGADWNGYAAAALRLDLTWGAWLDRQSSASRNSRLLDTVTTMTTGLGR